MTKLARIWPGPHTALALMPGRQRDRTAFIYLSHNQVIGRPLTRTGTGVTLASMVVASTLVVGISASFHLRQNIPVQTVGRSMSMPVRR